MKIAGIIAEYNPFHGGHAYQIEQTRKAGASHIVAVMSGNYVQRGEPAFLEKHARAEMALHGGADLVLELPLPWAVSSAEGSAGAVDLRPSAGFRTRGRFPLTRNGLCGVVELRLGMRKHRPPLRNGAGPGIPRDARLPARVSG